MSRKEPRRLQTLKTRAASKVSIQEQTLLKLARINPCDSAKSARMKEADSIRRLALLTPNAYR